MKTLVFVYGTLKKGRSNHGFMRSSALVGRGRTASPCALYLGDYPFLVKSPALHHVRGEVYAVTRATLDALDRLEEHPDVYRRELAEILLDSGKAVQAWVYWYPRVEGRLLEDGEY